MRRTGLMCTVFLGLCFQNFATDDVSLEATPPEGGVTIACTPSITSVRSITITRNDDYPIENEPQRIVITATRIPTPVENVAEPVTIFTGGWPDGPVESAVWLY